MYVRTYVHCTCTQCTHMNHIRIHMNIRMYKHIGFIISYVHKTKIVSVCLHSYSMYMYVCLARHSLDSFLVQDHQQSICGDLL